MLTRSYSCPFHLSTNFGAIERPSSEASSSQKIVLEVFHPCVALVQLRIRREIKRSIESASSRFEVRLLCRTFWMGGQVIDRLKNLLPFLGQNEIDQEHRRMRMRRPCHRRNRIDRCRCGLQSIPIDRRSGSFADMRMMIEDMKRQRILTGDDQV